jgi:hypothetical protein
VIDEWEGEARAIGHVGASLAFHVGRATIGMGTEPSVEFARDAAQATGRDFGELGPWTELQRLLGAMADAISGDFQGAVERLEGAAERFSADTWTDMWWATQFVYAAHYDATRARAILREHEQRLPVAGRPAALGTRQALGFLIDGLKRLGEQRRAAELYPVCVESIELGMVISMTSDVMEHAAAAAALAGGDWDLAERHFRSGLRLADDEGNVISQASTRLGYAEALLDRGEPEGTARARTLLEEAIPIYERMGSEYYVGVCRELLATSS